MTLVTVSKDRVTVLFGFLILLQALILFGGFFLFADLPSPLHTDTIDSDVTADSGQPEAVDGLTEDPNTTMAIDEVAVETDNEKRVTHLVKSGDTLASIWNKNGAPLYGASQAAKAFKEAGVSSTALRRGEQLELIVSLAGDITDLTRQLDDGRTLIIQGNSIDGYVPTVLNAEISEQEKTVTGTVFSSFFAAATERGIPYAVIDEFVDLFSGRIEFSRDFQPGDTFTVNYIDRKCEGQALHLPPGPIMSASIRTASNLLVAIRHVSNDGRAYYFDENGEPLGNFFLRYPLKFSFISSSFSWARFHPVLQRTRPHLGVDFAAPLGTPVRSVADGIVTEAGYNSEAGNMIKISHSERYSTAYLHLFKLAPTIRKGSHVSRGQIIGTVGSTGLSTGPHLHFALFDRGTYLDPLSAKLPKMPDDLNKIPKNLLLATLNQIKQQHEIQALAMGSAANKRS